MSALVFAAGNVVDHLRDYEPFERLAPYFTAHHVLLLVVAAAMIVGFRVVARRVRTKPKPTGLTSLVEVALVWIRDEIVYAWLGEARGRRYVYFFWTLFFFILLCNLLGLLPFPLNPWHRTATGNIAGTACD